MGIVTSLLPFSIRCEPDGDVLCAHLAKGNRQIDELREQPPTSVLFHGPQGYVSPSWYATKREHGRVVPTWNFVVVQVWGTPTIRDDVQWLREQIEELTNAAEKGFRMPWKVADAPEDFIQAQMKGIVGLEIPVSRIEGKRKLSQNQPDRNQAGVIAGLRETGQEALADAVAEGRRQPDDFSLAK
ncbi:transcriptional regulator [Sphingomonas kaistensis]|uniref:Transcriptional regulator n=1 Tax=Sphingomonas kaistensis TaxID=298708 RepID=A0A7X6BGG2_9SPHN|nr:transcriptional regulator [Sphingomonas kaistensis]